MNIIKVITNFIKYHIISSICIALLLTLLVYSSSKMLVKMSDTSNKTVFADFFKVKYVSLGQEYNCNNNSGTGHNNNKICQKKFSEDIKDRYYLKQYPIYYAIDMLHNVALMDFFEFKYPNIEIWIDVVTDEFYIASQHYQGFKPIHDQAEEQDYSVDIMMNAEQKIDYLTALFFIGDIHVSNIGLVNNEIVVIDYDDWAIKHTEHYWDWSFDFIARYAFSRDYFTFTAGDLVKVGQNIEKLFSNDAKRTKLEVDLNHYYKDCIDVSRYPNMTPFSIMYDNAMKIAQCLKSFEHWKPHVQIDEDIFQATCLSPRYTRHYHGDDLKNEREKEFFSRCYQMFDDKFYASGYM